MLRRFEVLASFYGPGRKLTQAGHPTLADARELVGAMGLGDHLGPEVGGRTWRTRSAAELPDLSFSLRWALRAGVVRKEHGRLRQTASWAQLSAAQRLQRSADALMALGPLAGYYGDGPAGAAEAVDSAFPSLLLRLAEGPLGYPEALSQLTSYMHRHYRWPEPWAEEAKLRGLLDHDLSQTVQLLELAGILQPPPGSPDEQPGSPAAAVSSTGPRLRLLPGGSGPADHRQPLVPTPVGLWLVPRLAISGRAPQVYAPSLCPPTASVHELRVSLDDVEPEIWRSLAVPSSLSLAGLHLVVQEAMGWQGYHLHEISVGDKRYGVDDGEGWDGPPEDERRYRLADVAPEGQSFSYVYDFGDDWQHTISVQAVRPALPGEDFPRCTGGERACPPEDVGGTPGYQEFLVAISDPSDEEHDHYLEWAGGGFDPEHFDLAEANRRIADLVRATGSAPALASR